jgi:hypothetical protein
MSLMYYLKDDLRSMAGNFRDNYVLYILEPSLDVSDVDFTEDDVKSIAGNSSKIITCFYSGTFARCLRCGFPSV